MANTYKSVSRKAAGISESLKRKSVLKEKAE